MKLLNLAFNREKYSVCINELRSTVILAPSPDSKQKHASFHWDECFLLGCYLILIAKTKLSKGLRERLKGALGPNFFKVAAAALADPVQKTSEDFAQPLREQNFQLKKQIDDLKETHRQEMRQAQCRESQDREKLQAKATELSQANERLTKLTAEFEKLCRDWDSLYPPKEPLDPASFEAGADILRGLRQ